MGGQSRDDVQLAMAGVAIRVLGPAVIAVTPAAQKAAEQLINGVSGLKDWVFNDSGTQPVDIVVPGDKYPEAAGHIRDAQGSGQPDVLTIDRGGAKGR